MAKEQSEQIEITKAKFRMALYLLIFFLITLAWGYVTYPFLGFTASFQNVIYGLIVGAPFWIAILITLIKINKEKS